MGFEKNTLVYTAKGVRRIGDLVLGYDREYHIVHLNPSPLQETA